MTNEQAIYLLQNLKMPYWLDQEAEAVKVAIESLTERKGKWIVDGEFIDCSVCRREKWSRVPYEDLVKRFRYCPNCGAKMEGAEE